MEGLRYSTFYFWYYAFLAFVLSFFPVYLDYTGLSAEQIAYVLAAGNLAIIIGAYLSVGVVARVASVWLIVGGCAWGALIGFLPLFYVKSFWPILFISFLVIALHKGCGVHIDAVTIRHSAAGRFNFEHLRVWGSLGFIFAVYILGLGIDHFGPGSLLPIGTAVLTLILGSAFLLRPLVRREKAKECLDTGGIIKGEQIWRKDWFATWVKLLSVAALIWASHAVMSLYLSLYLKELGWSGQSISLAWIVGVIAEVVAFILFPKLSSRFSLLTILRFSVLATLVRWALMGLSSSAAIIIFSQLLHAFSFGTFYLASTKLVFRILPDNLRDRGQGWFVAFGAGLGALLGRLIAGYLAKDFSSFMEVQRLFLESCILVLIAILIAFKMRINDVKNSDSKQHTSVQEL